MMVTSKGSKSADAASPDTRQKLLDAGLKVFGQKGFAGATTREIAAEAGVFQPQISYFFSGKEQLWQAVVDMAFRRFDDVLDTLCIESGQPIEQRVEALVHAYVDFAADNPDWARIVVRERGQDTPQGDWLTERWLGPRTTKLILALLGRPQADLTMPQLVTTMSLLSILTGAAAPFMEVERYISIAGIHPASADFRRRHAHIVTVAIIAGVKSLS